MAKIFIWPASQVSIAGGATEAKQDDQIVIAQDTLTELDSFHTDNNTKVDLSNTRLLSINSQLSTLNTNNTSQNAAILQSIDDGRTENTNAFQILTDAAKATFFDLEYDALVVTAKTADGPTVIESRVGGVAGALQQTLTITYDVDGDFESAEVT